MHMITNKSTVDMIYLDFSKAFDEVDHGIHLHKLRDLGIRGRLGLWFFHFLNNEHADFYMTVTVLIFIGFS